MEQAAAVFGYEASELKRFCVLCLVSKIVQRLNLCTCLALALNDIYLIGLASSIWQPLHCAAATDQAK